MAKPKTARKPTDHRFQWRDIKLRVRHTPDYINPGWSMLEIHVVAPKGAPKAAGCATGNIYAWLNREAIYY